MTNIPNGFALILIIMLGIHAAVGFWLAHVTWMYPQYSRAYRIGALLSIAVGLWIWSTA